MQSRTFLRIEGDLVSLVTEVTDREVTLPDLLTELTSSQLAITPRLPTGCRFWLRSGTTAGASSWSNSHPAGGRSSTTTARARTRIR